jgi:MFS family permease
MVGFIVGFLVGLFIVGGLVGGFVGVIIVGFFVGFLVGFIACLPRHSTLPASAPAQSRRLRFHEADASLLSKRPRMFEAIADFKIRHEINTFLIMRICFFMILVRLLEVR